jgi:hypothetical protein
MKLEVELQAIEYEAGTIAELLRPSCYYYWCPSLLYGKDNIATAEVYVYMTTADHVVRPTAMKVCSKFGGPYEKHCLHFSSNSMRLGSCGSLNVPKGQERKNWLKLTPNDVIHLVEITRPLKKSDLRVRWWRRNVYWVWNYAWFRVCAVKIRWKWDQTT